MLAKFLPLAVTALLSVGALAQDKPPSCALDRKCPKSAPCCSQYGQCGTGAFCLGGCDPRMSFSLDACVPAPVCKSKKYSMDSMDRVVSMDKYLGDADKHDWVYQGEPVEHNGNILLTMPRESVGTVMASTTYMWYGTVKAKLKTSRGAGVVTAFILYSDVKDEIDYEWVGTDLDTVQTNYYFQGIPLYDQGGNITVEDTYSEWHEYEIRWTPEEITWAVDGKVGRTKKKSDTWNETFSQWDYPQTPSRVQLSLWPGGLASNAKGTIDWAGGEIDWDSEDIKKNGYYHATFGEVSVECWDGDSPPGTNKGKSYIYNDILATNDTVEDTKKRTTIKSFQASGLDMDKGDKDGDASHNIPGGNTVGGSGKHDDEESSDSGSGGGGSGGGGSGSGSGGGDGGGSGRPSCDSGSFSQDCGGEEQEGGGDESGAASRGASFLGVVVALGAVIFV